MTTPYTAAIPANPWTRRTSVAVEGRDVDLLTLGSQSDEPLLFLHGWGANPQVYLRSLTGLASRRRFVIAPALPSFGRSEPLPLAHQTVNGVAEHIMALLIEQYADRAPLDVVGHSFGGGVSLRIAATRPDLVKSLTLVCPVGGAGNRAQNVPALVCGMLRGDGGQNWLRNSTQHFLPALIRHPSRVVASGISAWFSNQIRDVEAVEAAGIPVRFIFAKKDLLIRPGSIPAHASATIRVELKDGHHSWCIGESERFTEAVLGPVRDAQHGAAA